MGEEEEIDLEEVKLALQKLHIDYINYCAHVIKEPWHNFWGINCFENYIDRFGPGYMIIRDFGLESTVDFASEIGYDLES